MAAPIADGADGPDCLHRLIAAQVERTPDAPALAHGSRILGYRELWDRAGRLARRLRASGRVPATLYGRGVDATSIHVSAQDLLHLFHQGGGSSVLVDLKLDGEEHLTIVREVQRDHIHNRFIHVDFMAVRRDEAIVVPGSRYIDWLVPGLWREKCIALIKALPKALRRNFVPVPDIVDKVLPNLQRKDGSLQQSLARQLLRLTGVQLPGVEAELAWGCGGE